MTASPIHEGLITRIFSFAQTLFDAVKDLDLFDTISITTLIKDFGSVKR